MPETNENFQPDEPQVPQLELAFEYLVAKDSLQWVTIYSDEVS